MKINGHDVPWSVVILCGTLLANGIVAYWRVGQVEDHLAQHVDRYAHPEIAGKVLVLEEKVKKLEKELDKLD